MDLDARVWTVPAGRMKDGQEHRVPLSDAACGVLRAARARRTGLVFTGARGAHRQGHAQGAADLGADTTVHGLRSTFRDWCGEGGVAREVAEMCLAHAANGSVESAYARGDLLARRAEVMERWGRFLEAA